MGRMPTPPSTRRKDKGCPYYIHSLSDTHTQAMLLLLVLNQTIFMLNSQKVCYGDRFHNGFAVKIKTF